MGTPGVVRATGTTEGLAAIFLSQPLQPISSDDASCAPAPKKLACYWCALAPGQAIRDLTSDNVTKRPGKRRPLHPRLAKSYWGGKIRSREVGWGSHDLRAWLRGNKWLGTVDWKTGGGNRSKKVGRRGSALHLWDDVIGLKIKRVSFVSGSCAAD